MFCIWFTGLSGAGKTTLALKAQEKFGGLLLDADDVRATLNSDLGYNSEDRAKNVERIGHVAKLILDQGMPLIVACTSPDADVRNKVLDELRPNCLFLLVVHADATLSCVVGRDPKGLYEKRRQEIITNMVGTDIPYEKPTESKECLRVNTTTETVDECIGLICTRIYELKKAARSEHGD